MINCILIPVRDGFIPRATLFLRDQSGEFDVSALQTARIDITAVFESEGSVQVFGILGRIWDDPQNAFNNETHSLPLEKPGSKGRLACEFIANQGSIDLVIFTNEGRTILNRRIDMPQQMREAIAELCGFMDSHRAEGYEFDTSEVQSAVSRFQLRHEASCMTY